MSKTVPKIEMTTESFCTVMSYLENRADLRQGITRSIEVHTLTRTVPNYYKTYAEGVEEYLMQQVNVLYAAHHILQDNKKSDDDLQGLIGEVNQALTSAEEKPDIRIFNSRLVEILKKQGIKNPQKSLNLYKEFNSMELPHYHIVTINGTERTENKVISHLTEEQKNQLEQRKEDKKSPGMKRLIENYLGKIYKGEPAVLPTQLFKEFPTLLRNAYEVSVYLDEELISRSFRFGAPGNPDKPGNSDAFKQLAEYVGKDAGKPVTVIPQILTSPRTFGLNKVDEKLTKSLDNQVEEKSGNCTTVGKPVRAPLNFFRRFSKPEFGGYQPIFDQAKAILKEGGMAKVDAFLDSQEKVVPTQIIDEIQKSFISYGAKKALINLVQTKAAMNAAENKNWFTRLFDSENRNLQVITRMALVAADVSNGGPLQEFVSQKTKATLQNFGLSNSCKSAKDRAAVAIAYARALIMAERKDTNEQEGKPPPQVVNTVVNTKANDKVAIQENLIQIINSGEMQVLAGSQGGGLGCRGVKGDTRTSIPESDKEVMESIFQKCANYNKIKILKIIHIFSKKPQTPIKEVAELEVQTPSPVVPTKHAQLPFNKTAIEKMTTDVNQRKRTGGLNANEIFEPSKHKNSLQR